MSDKPVERSQKLDNGDVSIKNSTVVPLGSSETFTGEWEDVADYSSITVVALSDATGTLCMETSIDGVIVDRPVEIPSDTAGNFGVHGLIVMSRYFRVKIINDATPQTLLRVQTLYNVSSKITVPTSRLVQPLTQHVDVINTRSVLVGETEAGEFLNVPVSPSGKLQVDIPTTAFGEVSMAEKTPQVQLQFPYNINSAQVIAFPGNGGSVGNGNSHANMSTGTEADGFALLLSRDVLKYNAGQGAVARFTALFTTGVADSEQCIGCGNALNGFFFGYNGADFGVLRRSGGKPELRELEITVGSTTAEDITITLDGIAVTDVTVTNSGDATITAREIADHSFANVGTGWGARVAGNKITFISIEPISKSGVYSITNATTATGDFSLIGAGQAPTNVWEAQTTWNMDTMDGEGLSHMDLDHTKGNVYQISFQWLGYGMITFSIENSESGQLIPVHRIKYGNLHTAPSVANPSFPMFASATNMGNTSNLTLQTASMAAFLEGRDGALGPQFSVTKLLAYGTGTDERPILTIRNKQVYQGIINQVRIQPTLVGLTSNLATANGVTTFRVYEFSRPEVGTNYVDVSLNGSVVEWDNEALDFNNDFARLVTTVVVEQVRTELLDIMDQDIRIAPGITYLITAQASKSNAQNEVGASITWKELF